MANSNPEGGRKVRVLSCNEWDVARILAVVCGLLGLLAGLTAPFWIGKEGGALVWILALVFFPFGSYFIGYIAGAFLAACLNLAMQHSGGLEIEVVPQPDAPSGVEPGPPAAVPGDDGSSNITAPPA
jgi:hypothetical protein